MEPSFDFKEQRGESASLSIKELIFKYIRFLPLFIFSVALTLLGAYVYLRYTTPVYYASGSIMLKDLNRTAGEGDRFAQLFVLDQSIDVQNEIELLRSRQLMERVVDKLDLNFSYFAVGEVKDENVYTKSPVALDIMELNDSSSSFTFDFEFDETGERFHLNEGAQLFTFNQEFKNEHGTFRLVRKPRGNLSKKHRVKWEPTTTVARRLASMVGAGNRSATGVLVISIEGPNPNFAADVVNQLMKEYQTATIEDKNETKRQTIDFVDERLAVVSRELDSLTNSIIGFQLRNNLVGGPQSGSYFSRIDDADNSIYQQQVQIDVAKMIAAYISNAQNKFNLVPSTLGLSDATLSTLISAYNVNQLERKGLIDANIPPTNARVLQKEEQIEQLRQNLFENLKNLTASFEASISRQKNRNTEWRTKMEQLPEKEQELLELKNLQQSKQEVYNFLMEKREETAISLAATISNIKVVENANPIATPVTPDKGNIRLIAIVIGLVLPAVFVVLKEVLNDKVSSRNDIEKVTDVPILGEVGHSYSEETLVVKPNSRGMVAEQFRIIRSNLQYVLSDLQHPVILVTSTFSGEGKSFISTNLGAVLSLANKRTIILEFDIRKPKILSGLDLPKKPGLTNWLLGKVAIEDLPIPVEGYSNLFVLACGPVPPNPAEILLSPQMDTLFAWLKKNFDVVVMDTAPVGIVSDALTLSRFANATLYITRQGRTLKKQVGLIDEMYHSSKLPHISVILNDVKVQTGYGYYSYGKYGYSYGYGESSGYFEEEKNGNGNGKGILDWLKGGKKSKKGKRKHTA